MRRLSKVIGALLVMVAAGAEAASEVTIFRGAATQIVATGRLVGVPTVLRGGGSVILPRSAPAPDPRLARAAYPNVTAGRTLWLVDQERRRITACYLRGTGYVDRRRIRCTRY